MDKVIREEIKKSKEFDIELEECLEFQDKISYIFIAIDEFVTDANVTAKSVSTFQSNIYEFPVHTPNVKLLQCWIKVIKIYNSQVVI